MDTTLGALEMPPTEEDTYRQFVRETLGQILEQAKITNGRVRNSEKAIAVLQVGYVVGAFVTGLFAQYVFNNIPVP